MSTLNYTRSNSPVPAIRQVLAEKRPADVIGNAVHVMRIATGEVEDMTTDDGKNTAAVCIENVVRLIS